MNQYAINTQNNKTFEVSAINETAVLLVVDGKVKSIKPSTFKRYYKLIEQTNPVEEKQTNKRWKNYYKPYKQNESPLWNATILNNELIILNTEKQPIMICSMSNSGRCVKVKQVRDNCKRYFTKFDVAKKHILNNQDIRTIRVIGSAYESWIADQKLLYQTC